MTDRLHERLQAPFVRATVAKVDDALQTRATLEPQAFWNVAADRERTSEHGIVAALAQSVVCFVGRNEPPSQPVDCRRAICFEGSGNEVEVYFNAFGTAMRIGGESFVLERGALGLALAGLPDDAAGRRVREILAPSTSPPER